MKTLQAWARLGIFRHLFTTDSLDPMNAPGLALELGELKRKMIQFASSPDGLEKQFYETVDELRKEFTRADPKLKIRYATAIESTETTH